MGDVTVRNSTGYGISGNRRKTCLRNCGEVRVAINERNYFSAEFIGYVVFHFNVPVKLRNSLAIDF
jgi:hypothetical protein